ncbi:DUF1543 domain-containing protein [Pseudoalteromonas lipolytica]|jgi:hypothetical protein|uniref:DUF1543 domain-containing protein n=1 Tax=Pseudoalteromonas lipolytica TaxID=570156 RepID=A0AAD0RY00_9GAMM|nr:MULTISPECIES: DUF1543 domain-containing protein [Pseudoalteromonas]AXV64471.1 DUF1543 domain-containing protein [Pseudoalteromonas donghaensis]EWH06315.1 hypothetical protein AT00_10140 [Pseudoalteromonas lipolytica SCSIO 04301]MCC9662941.1 DUF1543 domain-containing protein [Pseudoalteromonas sp. MB41]QLJ08952.1 DUF1543 domain-containing protein [Pseudoalteromonas sp. JSTW]QMW15184.1 DUF1543 domain-containing protein [Pseudoalteromonas sp. MT33b]
MGLYLVYLGGRIQGCHIEMHDVRFVVGDKIEDTYSKLKAQWVGDKGSVHMDSYMHIQHIDGYKVEVIEGAHEQPEKLYFVNLGAYRADSLAEQHDFALYVARSSEEAKQRAKDSLLAGLTHLHKDDLHDVDDCFAIDLLDSNLTLKLTPSGHSQAMKPDWFGYHVL